MPRAYIVSGAGGIPDISALDWRAADISIPDYTGDPESFMENVACTSDYFAADVREHMYISLKPNQPIYDITDCIEIGFQHGANLTVSVYKGSETDVLSLTTIFTAPWSFCRFESGEYGFVAWNKRDSKWEVFALSDYKPEAIVVNVYDFLETKKHSGISIRCPDFVRQGLFIIIACDSQEEPYIDFTCTLSGHTSPMTKLMQNTDKTLRLQCGSDEGASELLIEVASVYAPSVTVSKAITVIPYNGGGGGNGNGPYDPTSKVMDISLLAFPDTVAPGGFSIILTSVNGVGDYSQQITAQISGHSSEDTKVYSDGYFCNIAVGKDESAQSVLVTVTSVQDPTVFASVVVMVDHSGTSENPVTEKEQIRQMFWSGFSSAKAHFKKLHFSETATISVTKNGEPTTREGKLKRAFWNGFAAGAALASEVEGYMLIALGYYYGTCEEMLPELPVSGTQKQEWDREAYPYAVICYYSYFDYYSLIVSSHPIIWNGEKLVYDKAADERAQTRIYNWADNGADKYAGGFCYILSESNTPIETEGLKWTNTDIPTTDGGVYMEKSDPVPVYPTHKLASSDGYILQDVNGLYLTVERER